MKLVTGLIILVFSMTCQAQETEVTKEFSDVTIGESIAEDDSIFVNQLLDLLVKKSIFDEPSCSRLLVTFSKP